MRSTRLPAFLVAAILLPLATMLAAPAHADSTTVVDRANLGSGPTVLIGTSIYYFSNDGTIARHELSANVTTTMGAAFPQRITYPVAVTDGRVAYILGGMLDDGTKLTTIYRYDPSSDVLADTGARLPVAAALAAAAWDGSRAYVFGGVFGNVAAGEATDAIQIYDPATNTVALSAAHLPDTMDGQGAVWDGHEILVVGGMVVHPPTPGATQYQDSASVFRYSPATDTLRQDARSLPQPARYPAVFWSGARIYVIGGDDASFTASNEIMRFDPATDTTQTMASNAPTFVDLATAVWTGHEAYVWEPGKLWEYTLEPGAPGLTATQSPFPQNDAAGFLLSWWNPYAGTYESINGFDVLRGTTPGGEDVLVAHVAPTQHSLVDDPFLAEPLALHMHYYYRVRATSAFGVGLLSREWDCSVVASATQQLLASACVETQT